MAARHIVNVDLAKVFGTTDRKQLQRILTWGSAVEVIKITPKHVEVKTTNFETQADGSIKPVAISGFIVPPKGIKPSSVVTEMSKSTVLKVDFVDVQQGDGTVLETPKGKVVLIDGGDNQMFARYLASRYRGTSDDKPKEIDCIVVSHGDADHFVGLTKIHESETHPKKFKRLFIHPKRVYHNGLVKRPSSKNGKKVKDVDLLGRTAEVDGELVITELAENLFDVPDSQMNEPFKDWKRALEAFRTRGAVKFKRLERGDTKAFDFLAEEDVKVEVLGPMLSGTGAKRGLKFLAKPKSGPRIGPEVLGLENEKGGSPSASHTINGHSVILRITYKGFSFLLSGDLNDESGRELARAHNRGDLTLQAEVFKVPHHGSADFSGAFLQAVSPIISVVSSGDESARKEFIHPRATLVGALGKYSRLEEPLVFVTELVAFFEVEGQLAPEGHKMKNEVAVVKDGAAVVNPKARTPFFAFSRAAFGLVTVRTDGERLLVCTNSGRVDLKEAYAFVMDDHGKPIPSPVRMV